MPKMAQTPPRPKAYAPPNLTVRLIRQMVGMCVVLFLFYVIGHYLTGWPFPTPLDLGRIATAVVLGSLLGLVYSRFWPLPPTPGFERIFRLALLLLPALVLGYALQILVSAGQALSIIVPVAAWLGSGFIVRLPEGQPPSRLKSK